MKNVSLNIVRAAFAGGVSLMALAASSMVAFKFDHAPELGSPLWGYFYNPLDIIKWGMAWGLDAPYRSDFIGGIGLAALFFALPLAAVRLMDMYGPLKVGERSPNEGLGDAKLLLKTGHIANQGNGVVIGRHGRHALRDSSDGHVLIEGPARSGKGTGHVVPTLLGHTGPMFVFDPKHELEGIAGRRRRQLGPVYTIDPTNPRGNRFNPLLELRQGEHLTGDCQMLAHMIAHSGGSRDDQHWDTKSGEILHALLVHVCLSDDPTLAHVYRAAHDVAIDVYPDSSVDLVARTLASHRDTEQRARDSVNSTLLGKLAFLADPMVQEATSRSDFRASDLQASLDPVTVFLAIPVADGQRLRRLTRMVIQSMLAPLLHDINFTADGRRKVHPVMVMLDEFPQLGRLDVIEHGIPVCAGYGVRMILVCQDVDQIQSAYGSHQSITGNCSTICVTPGYSANSLRTLTAWGGDHAITHRSRQKPIGMLGRGSESQSETRAPVLNPRDLITRGKDEVLVFTRGVPPTWLPRASYYKMREFDGMHDQHTGVETPAATPLASTIPQEGGREQWLQIVRS